MHRLRLLFTAALASTFGEPLYLESREGEGRIEGDVYADMALPFARVSQVLGSAESVCALLAYSSVTTGTPQAQAQARLRAWFALTEHHAAQLHELDLADYLQEKNSDLVRPVTHGQ